MFDQADYYSDEQDLAMKPHTPMASSKVLVPSSASDFNHLTGEGESLLKIMKDRGFDMTDNELNKIKTTSKSKEKNTEKTKQKAGYFDGGNSASFEELVKALNKAFSKADPQQASCILTYILEKKNLSPQDRDKFGIMKCKILFGLGAYQDCLQKATELLNSPLNRLSAAILSNYLAKCKAESGSILEGYMDFLRAKFMINEYRETEQQAGGSSNEEFADTEIDSITREINHTELEYNIKMSKYKNSTNLVHPLFPQFRHRRVKKVACGDFHALFLVQGSLDRKHEEQGASNAWRSEVFGIGENSVGQITGKSTQTNHKEPVLISQLSGKGIQGVWAVKESSLAYDINGNIYQWGIKENRNQKIDLTYSVGEQIIQFQKGYQHYAALTVSKKFYTWGVMQVKNTVISKQGKPFLQPSQNIISFSCGTNSIVAIDQDNDAFCMGSNEFGQLGFEGQMSCKAFRKMDKLGQIRKAYCVQDVTFFISTSEEVFFCGRISYKKDCVERLRQAEFGDELAHIISVSGTVGNYFVCNEMGDLYRWDVDASVKFKKDMDKIGQRYVNNFRGTVLRVKSLVDGALTRVERLTQNPKSFEQIIFSLDLFDQFGPYANRDFVIPPRCQIFLSTHPVKPEELLKENALCLQNKEKGEKGEDGIVLSEIIESRLMNSSISEGEANRYLLKIQNEECGLYYFYVLMEEALVYQKELKIEVSEREQILSEKNAMEKSLKEQERRRKAEMQKQRLINERLRKQQEEEERRKETQRRAQDALKKHMRDQEEERLRIEDERKAKKELQTGGGFDLSKLRAKVEPAIIPASMASSSELNRTSELVKTSESFLPDINVRPVSKRKLLMPAKGSLISVESVRGEKPRLEDAPKLTIKKVESLKEDEGKMKTTTIIKRGLSKNKK